MSLSQNLTKLFTGCPINTSFDLGTERSAEPASIAIPIPPVTVGDSIDHSQEVGPTKREAASNTRSILQHPQSPFVQPPPNPPNTRFPHHESTPCGLFVVRPLNEGPKSARLAGGGGTIGPGRKK